MVLVLESEVGIVGDSEHDLVFVEALLGNVRICLLGKLVLLMLRSLQRDDSFHGWRQVAFVPLTFGRLGLLLCVRDLVKFKASIEGLRFTKFTRGLLSACWSARSSCLWV